MDIYLIWATDSDTNDVTWLVGAWDGDSIADNFSGYQEEVQKHQDIHGADRVRVVKAHIDFDKVVGAFRVPSVGELVVDES